MDKQNQVFSELCQKAAWRMTNISICGYIVLLSYHFLSFLLTFSFSYHFIFDLLEHFSGLLLQNFISFNFWRKPRNEFGLIARLLIRCGAMRKRKDFDSGIDVRTLRTCVGLFAGRPCIVYSICSRQKVLN